MKLKKILQRILVIGFLICVSWCLIRSVSQNGNVNVYGTEIGTEKWQVQNHGSQDVSYRAGFITSSQKEYGVQIKDIKVPANAVINVAIWSEVNGQDDIQWIPLVKNADGSWSAETGIYEYNSPGTYHVHMYMFPVSGEPQLLIVTDFSVSKEVFDKIKSENSPKYKFGFVDTTQKEYQFKIENLEVPSGAVVNAAVWSDEKGQDDIQWIPLAKDTNGSWSAKTGIYEYNSAGIYYVHMYMFSESGVPRLLAENDFYVAKDVFDKLKYENQYNFGFVDGTQKEYQFKIANLNVPAGAVVNVAVWSDENAQDDIQWIPFEKAADGSWIARTRLSSYKSSGIFYGHIYVFPTTGGPQLLTTTEFYVEKSSGGSVKVTQTQLEKGTAVFKVFDIKEASSGVAGVEVKVWSKANQSDAKVYQAVKKNDAWYATMDIANHNYNWGTYHVEAYAIDGNGFKSDAGGTSVVFQIEGNKMETAIDTKNGILTVSFPEIKFPTGVQALRTAVWSEEKGQDDLTWHVLETPTSQWKQNIDLIYLNNAGVCHVHVYVQKTDGELILLNTANFNVDKSNLKGNIAVSVNNTAGTFEVLFGKVMSSGTIRKVEVDVWSQSDKNDLKTYTAVKNSNGAYSVVSNISEHKYNIGTYIAQVKVTNQAGVTNVVGKTTFEFSSQIGKGSVSGDKNKGYYNIRLDNVEYPAGLSSMLFAVWSDENGQDDLRWYTANASGKGYSYTVDVADHGTLGVYCIHAYGVNKAGKMLHLATIDGMNVQKLPETSFSVKEVTNQGTFTGVISNLQAVSGISKVSVAVWTAENNQTDLHWYDCEKEDNRKYSFSVNIGNHNYNTGKYIIHVYTTNTKGVEELNGTYTYDYNYSNNVVCVTGEVGSGKRTIAIKNPTSTNNLMFAVWGEKNGQNDLVWYKATKSSNGTWKTTVDISDHGESGKYNVHVYSDTLGLTAGTFEFDESEFKNGWRYEEINGRKYKLYYINNVLQKDVTKIIGRQSSYRIELNRVTCTVTIYAKDGANGYIIPVIAFTCSVGTEETPTPIGTFYTSEKLRWGTLMGPSYGQYCTRIVAGILFHSTPGVEMSIYNVDAGTYNLLGQPASHGCVRLCVRDAKWIYDNCPLATQVKIYDDDFAGPFGKPATIKIPAGQNWDPTDPEI